MKGHNPELWKVEGYTRTPWRKPCPECGGGMFWYIKNNASNIFPQEGKWICVSCGLEEES